MPLKITKGEILKILRERLPNNKRLEDVGKNALGLTKTQAINKIRNIETGAYELKDEELTKLADYYGIDKDLIKDYELESAGNINKKILTMFTDLDKRLEFWSTLIQKNEDNDFYSETLLIDVVIYIQSIFGEDRIYELIDKLKNKGKESKRDGQTFKRSKGDTN